MGTFTDNLLKLSEFPFSYSFIGLLAVIFYKHTLLSLNPEQIPLLLILMGFVATTLSITDPFGALQKYLLRKGRLPRKEVRNRPHQPKEFTFEIMCVWYSSEIVSGKRLKNQSVGDESESKDKSPEDRKSLGCLMYPPIGSSHRQKEQEDSKKSLGCLMYPPIGSSHRQKEQEDSKEDVDKLRVFGYDIADFLYSRSIAASLSFDFLKKAKTSSDESNETNNKDGKAAADIKGKYMYDVKQAVESLTHSTLRTKWVTREIDKINSMLYFMVVVSLFISVVIYPDTRDVILQGGDQTGGSAYQTAGGGVGVTTGGDQTGTISPTGGSLAPVAAIVIILVSILALGGVFYMFCRHLRELSGNALAAFQFLITQLAYLIARRANEKLGESFQKTLDEVEKRYLDSGDWTLAKLRVNHLIQDYRALFPKTFGSSSNQKGDKVAAFDT